MNNKGGIFLSPNPSDKDDKREYEIYDLDQTITQVDKDIENIQKKIVQLQIELDESIKTKEWAINKKMELLK